MPTDFFILNHVVTLVEGHRPAEVVAAREVCVGDLLDGWLRVESVAACTADDALVDLDTADGLRRFAARMPCLVERAA